MKKPIPITLVIPAYNEHKHLGACLKAIAQQTIMPARVIVVNNNSSDDTAKIARRFPFVTVVDETKQGIVYARNSGFDAVSRGIIGRIDADTILPPTWIAQVQQYYAIADHQQRALTGSSYFYNIRLSHLCGRIESLFAYTINRWLLGHYITYGSNMALPVELWHKVRHQTCLRTDIHEDLDLSIHLHRLGYKVDYLSVLRVGAKMRRVRSGRAELLNNLMLWPKTLRVHGLKTWPLGWIGAVLLYCAYPWALLLERLARWAGRPSLPE